MLPTRAKRPRSGFSLFEAIAAFAIVSTTALSAYMTVSSELRASERAQRMIEAESLIAERVAALDLLDDRSLRNLPDSVSAGRFAPPLEAYGWTTEATPHREMAGLYALAIQLIWPGGSLTVHSAQYRRPSLSAEELQ